MNESAWRPSRLVAVWPDGVRSAAARRRRTGTHGRGEAMRNFSRGLRATWPYRGRLIASIVCALLAAVLWSINLTAIYPVLSLLTNDKGWAEQLEDDIKALQKDSTELRARL